MSLLFAFLAGVGVMSLSIFCAGYAAFESLQRPSVRLAVLTSYLDTLAPHMPVFTIIDMEGSERVVRFSAVRESLLRIAKGQVERENPTGGRPFDA